MQSKKLLSVLCLLALVGCDVTSTSTPANSSPQAGSSSTTSSSSSSSSTHVPTVEANLLDFKSFN